MTNSNWRLHARKVIDDAMDEAKAQGLDSAAALKLIDSRYPFGERAMHPYQMWLSERRTAMQRLGIVLASGTEYTCKFCKDRGCIVCGGKVNR